MEIQFFKYQATGNDFIMIDEREQLHHLTQPQIKFLCNRHFGIGADGLILLQLDKQYDFKMVYYNSDGNQSTMCGNGGRCIVQFANHLEMIQNQTTFIAIDGEHVANVLEDSIKLQMTDIKEVKSSQERINTGQRERNKIANHYFLNTGSPHHVEFVENINDVDVVSTGRIIRNNVYGKEGSNVNFVEHINHNTIKMRTYERGVEDETLSCGTGVTAAAIASHFSGQVNSNTINVHTRGGDLSVSFECENEQYSKVFLVGNAKRVFHGKIKL